ncbi:SAC3/GANP/Nin1/mts3/eIF-3 p25 family-domain-containing protein [Kockovaella imperatae]|uniref:SAC3/GANP/Nin1/mts3/eIF-3 p25 family-domain-containing protein n=1 Tax=Kockovaella imperatae TaxID=4999 RepID=A0A1Y1UQV2_9TREE|nr:SAC3/GANP/Nin1/mts3/eIF-3 p25 family-domain-containing protein [Kockovaella imperatae]ORX39816.1 SAC3/GANP/Nin1/mts3/eIF-3 p25 family-domain-containing protein [Kockovaella imperatae]
MTAALQQELTQLHSLVDGPPSSAPEISQRLAKLKVHFAQSGLLFASPDSDRHELALTRSVLEIGAFHALRSGNIKSYLSYDSLLLPFYDNAQLDASPNRPIILGLRLLYWLSEGDLTAFHTMLETLDPEQLQDVFIKLAVDLERWLMEGSYNKVYRARDRVPRPEFGFLLERLMGQVRSQIAATVETSYTSLPLSNAATLLFYKSGETSQLVEFATQRGWELSHSTSTFTFPLSPKPDIAIAAAKFSDPNASAQTLDILQGKGVKKGTPMTRMVGPSLRLAQQLEAVV